MIRLAILVQHVNKNRKAAATLAKRLFEAETQRIQGPHDRISSADYITVGPPQPFRVGLGWNKMIWHQPLWFGFKLSHARSSDIAFPADIGCP